MKRYLDHVTKNSDLYICINNNLNCKASDGFDRIMEIQPTELHERVPFFCGSNNMVEKAEDFMHKAKLSKY